MLEYLHILILIGLSIIFVGIAIIISIHDKKNILTENESDFISDIYNSKQKTLLKQQSPFNADTYFLTIISLTIIIGFVIFILSDNIIMSVMLALTGVTIPDVITKALQSKREKIFEQRYGSALKQLSSSLRSGLSIQQAVEDLCNCVFIHESIRSMFVTMNADLQLGISVKDAFYKFAEMTGSDDAYDVAAAISMQVKVGGNEAKVVENVAKNISSRIMLRREIKSTFADTKMTVMAMEIIPTIIVIGLCVMAKGYIGIYFESITMTIVFVVIVAVMIAGSFITQNILNKNEKNM